MSVGLIVLGAGVAAAGLAGIAYLALLWSFRVPRIVSATDPAAFGCRFEAVRVPTVRSRSLFGWYLPAAPGAAAVAVIHGWGAGADSLLPLGASLNRAGYAVLLVDARSHGASDGDSFSSMPRFAEDLDSALDWLKARPGPPPSRLVVLGHSVGGAAALLCASRRDDLAAVVSLSAFDHPERVMQVYFDRAHIPYRPVGWLLNRIVERVIGHRFDDIAPLATIGRIRCPVLIGHGAEDELVPAAVAAAIAARGDPARVEVHILADSTHDRPASFDLLGEIIVAFLARKMA
ncbi:alpha/beta hydrolase [Magnetospirillum fulvum]|uniref:Alpha/beta hydrolase family protein n=1 Tax=Magnetospirillum fulvum TaxID=1082 RepID=A0A1H6HWS6_MAGFU|nr:alpha/beta fold hydrolase [Magnetospirillum fulvum]SEH40393.1 Alpha/beta hydrolase family protein [Magnetospirillum fulvum]